MDSFLLLRYNVVLIYSNGLDCTTSNHPNFWDNKKHGRIEYKIRVDGCLCGNDHARVYDCNKFLHRRYIEEIWISDTVQVRGDPLTDYHCCHINQPPGCRNHMLGVCDCDRISVACVMMMVWREGHV
jgi:hypothetical protein